MHRSHEHWLQRKPSPIIHSHGDLRFDSVFSNHMVLQQAPAKSALYGTLDGSEALIVTVRGSDGRVYDLRPTVSDRSWLVYLPPTNASVATYEIAVATIDLRFNATIVDVAFGDVWVCSGQSNMGRSLQQTYHANQSVDAARLGQYDNIRLMGGGCADAHDREWLRASAAAVSAPRQSPSEGRSELLLASAAPPQLPGPCPEQTASASSTSPCTGLLALCGDPHRPLFRGGKGSTDAGAGMRGRTRLRALSDAPPLLGAVCQYVRLHTGSYIEQWTTRDTLSACKHTFADVSVPVGNLYHKRIAPLTRMSIKGILWYQVGAYIRVARTCLALAAPRFRSTISPQLHTPTPC